MEKVKEIKKMLEKIKCNFILFEKELEEEKLKTTMIHHRLKSYMLYNNINDLIKINDFFKYSEKKPIEIFL